MTKLQLEIDYGRPKEMVEQTNNLALTQNYIEFAVNQKFPQLKGQLLRVYSRIQRKLEAAVEAKQPDLELEAAEVDFIKDAFKDVAFSSGLAKFAVRLIDVIDNLGKEEKPAA